MASPIESLLVLLTLNHHDLARKYVERTLSDLKLVKREYRRDLHYSGSMIGLHESWKRHQADGLTYTEFMHDDVRRLGFLLSTSPNDLDEDGQAVHDSVCANLRGKSSKPFAQEAMAALNQWHRANWF